MASFSGDKNSIFVTPISKAFTPKLAAGYGVRLHPVLKVEAMHFGIDITAQKGALIRSLADGKVVEISDIPSTTDDQSKYGKCVIIQHSNGFKSLYAHLKRKSKS